MRGTSLKEWFQLCWGNGGAMSLLMVTPKCMVRWGIFCLIGIFKRIDWTAPNVLVHVTEGGS